MLFLITCDYESFGVRGDTFQVVELIDENGTDYTFVVNQDKPYFSLQEVALDIASSLSVPPEEIELEEI